MKCSLCSKNKTSVGQIPFRLEPVFVGNTITGPWSCSSSLRFPDSELLKAVPEVGNRRNLWRYPLYTFLSRRLLFFCLCSRLEPLLINGVLEEAQGRNPDTDLYFCGATGEREEDTFLCLKCHRCPVSLFTLSVTSGTFIGNLAARANFLQDCICSCLMHVM